MPDHRVVVARRGARFRAECDDCPFKGKERGWWSTAVVDGREHLTAGVAA